MKPVFLLVLLLSGCCAVSPLKEHVAFLSSTELEGREIGSEGERKAGEYIAGRFRLEGLETSFQDFEGHGFKGRNVIGVIPGTELEEAVVIGAHYDHLGLAEKGMTLGTAGKIHPGADDNASGTAVVLEMARRFGEKPARRSIVLIAFSGEEYGLFGSAHYVGEPVRPAVAMINLDMVGRLRERLIILGTGSGDRFKEYLADSPIPIAYGNDPVGPSDHASFYRKKIPAVHFFTGLHRDYHTERDRLETLDFGGMDRIADLVETLARRIADAPERMEWRLIEMPTVKITSGARPFFGSMPDYGYAGRGARLAGVIPGGPAEKAGLKEGDVVVAIDGKETPDINVYAEVLFSREAGIEVEIVFEREGKTHTVKVRLLARRPRPEKPK